MEGELGALAHRPDEQEDGAGHRHRLDRLSVPDHLVEDVRDAEGTDRDGEHEGSDDQT